MYIASDPAHTKFLAEKVAQIVVSLAFMAAALYFNFRNRQPSK